MRVYVIDTGYQPDNGLHFYHFELHQGAQSGTSQFYSLSPEMDTGKGRNLPRYLIIRKGWPHGNDQSGRNCRKSPNSEVDWSRLVLGAKTKEGKVLTKNLSSQ